MLLLENAPQLATTSLRHKQSRIEGLSKNENPQKRRPSATQTRRKPTLIRNLGGAGAPKGEWLLLGVKPFI